MTGAPTGLVPSINKWNAEGSFFPSAVSTITVDKVKARCTRLRKNLGVAAKWLSGGTGQCWMLTMTYARVEGWDAQHVAYAIRLLRQWLKRAYGWRLRYLWVMETKVRKSGDQKGHSAPHYHLVVWVPHQVKREDLELDSKGWWPHGLTNAVKAVAPVKYVMKYSSKFDNEGAFPKGARIYGIGGLDSTGAACRRWINWPAFVQGNSAAGDRSRRATGGGWVIGSTGEWFPSEWGMSSRCRQSTRLVRLHRHPRLVEADGPFSWLPGASS